MGFIWGFKVGGEEGVIISHLQLADDTIIFCDGDLRQMSYLRCFKVVYSLKINLANSEMFQVGDVCDIVSLAWILGCNIGHLPSYLGLPLGGCYKLKVLWELAIERILAILEAWKVPLLSKGGRLTLVKATLVIVPNYLLSLFTIPVLIANRMKALFKIFIWDDDLIQHRYHLVDWNTCSRTMKMGSLGIMKIQIHNKVLLAKCLKIFGIERDSLWRRVVVDRFGEKSC